MFLLADKLETSLYDLLENQNPDINRMSLEIRTLSLKERSKAILIKRKY